jgi:hypothetical protein
VCQDDSLGTPTKNKNPRKWMIRLRGFY